jgi:general nucleoside transport system permease protein
MDSCRSPTPLRLPHYDSTKPGWGRPRGAEGTGRIPLTLVIFGGWHTLMASLGAYLFSFLQLMAFT